MQTDLMFAEEGRNQLYLTLRLGIKDNYNVLAIWSNKTFWQLEYTHSWKS